VKHDKRIGIRLSEVQRRRVREGAESEGVSISQYIRDRMFAPKKDLSDIAYQLHRIGVNLNQIARRVNVGDGIDPDKLEKIVGEIYKEIKRVRGVI